MELKNKLGLEGLEFQHEEERISKQKAKRLYDEHMREPNLKRQLLMNASH